MLQIYYAEDDGDIAQGVQTYLQQQNCAVTVFSTAAGLQQALLRGVPDVVLVDWNLPDGRGDALCRWIRQRWPGLPVIFLTVRGDSNEIVTGFQCGADDYVVKPFALNVLHSRILALLRRVGQTRESRLYCDRLVLDPEKMAVYDRGQEVTLSQPEYRLLLLLMKNKGKTVTRRQLLAQVWDCDGNFVNDNTLTVTVKRLREKLHDPACLKTIRSFGYRMEDSL